MSRSGDDEKDSKMCRQQVVASRDWLGWVRSAFPARLPPSLSGSGSESESESESGLWGERAGSPWDLAKSQRRKDSDSVGVVATLVPAVRIDKDAWMRFRARLGQASWYMNGQQSIPWIQRQVEGANEMYERLYGSAMHDGRGRKGKEKKTEVHATPEGARPCSTFDARAFSPKIPGT
jgi:hypothetical protein